jgi:DNA-binding beta-propeller fold protein YncE
MRRFRWVRGVVVVGLAGALVGVVPDGASAVAGRARCRPIAFITNGIGGSVSTIDVKTRTKNPTDITLEPGVVGVAVTPDGKTAFVTSSDDGNGSFPSRGAVSTIDVKARKKNPSDIPVGAFPFQVAITPCRR